MTAPFLTAVAALRAVAEPTRLRLLALLMQAELTVGEICEIVGQSQPRVSRHLKLLCDAGLIDRLREQYWVYYRVPAMGAERDVAARFVALVAHDDEVIIHDRHRMERVIAERARRAATASVADPNFSAQLHSILIEELGNEPIGALLDIGTGSGHMLKLLAARAHRAVGIDISSDALRMARANIYGAAFGHCELQRGDMYNLPFAAALFDMVTVGRVLAAAEAPTRALSEISRTLKHDGRLLLIDDFDALEKNHRNNPIATVRQWFVAAGLEFQRVHPVDTEHGHWLIAVGRRVLQASAAA